jgi:hypothetical protein
MEKISHIVAAHIRNVEEQLSAARARVAALEMELANTKRAQENLPDDEETLDLVEETATEPTDVPASEPANSHARMSIKALALEALKTHFREGATAVELLEHFSKAYGRKDVPRTSLSPQLTILKNEGKIHREGLIWRIVENG